MIKTKITESDGTLIKATAVYANLPLATTKPIRLKIRDKQTAANLLMLICNYHRGLRKSPYVKITFTDKDFPSIKAQGISTEGLTHFIIALDSRYDQEVTDENKRSMHQM